MHRLPLPLPVRRLSCGLVFGAMVALGCSSPDPLPPVVLAAGPSGVAVAAWARLDGSGSTDPNKPARPLAFRWDVVASPEGGHGVVDAPTSMSPSFRADASGDYKLRLTVSNGLHEASADLSLKAGPCGGQAPEFEPGTAKATPSAAVVGQAVTFQAHAFDPDDDAACGAAAARPLAVKWRLSSTPAGSLATLSTADQPSFVPDLPGEYVATVHAEDATGRFRDEQVKVTATAAKAPVAKASGPSSAAQGAWAQLDGSASTDTNEPPLPLAFRWEITTMPEGGHAVVDAPTATSPSFSAEASGDYTVRLTVSNGAQESGAELKITVTAPKALVAKATGPSNVQVGVWTRLDGSASLDLNAPTKPLAYRWEIRPAQNGGHAVIDDPAAPSPSFRAEAAGTYDVRLTVSNAAQQASTDLSLTASACGVQAPVVTALAATPDAPKVGSPVQLSADASDADNAAPCSAAQTLAWDWRVTRAPAGSQLRIAEPWSANPSVVPDIQGDYAVALRVTDATGLTSAARELRFTATVCTPQPATPTVSPAGPMLGDLVTLTVQANSSCPASDPATTRLRYDWTVVTSPANATVAVTGQDVATVRPNQAGSYTLRVVVTDGAGRSGSATVPFAVSASLLPTGKLAIGFWCGVPDANLSQAAFDDVAAAGFTFANHPCGGGAFDATSNKRRIALAYGSGLDTVVYDGRIAAARDGVNVEANLDAAVADYKDLPGLAGYFVQDEPDASGFPALAAVVGGLRRRDPLHFANVNLLPDYATPSQLGAADYPTYVSSFRTTVNPPFLSWDYYRYLTTGIAPTFFQNLATVRTQALAGHIPFRQYIQAFGFGAGTREPTSPEKRLDAMETLAYGGTGVMWFIYWGMAGNVGAVGSIVDDTGRKTWRYPEIAAVNKSIAAIGRYLVPATSTGVFHNVPSTVGTRPREAGSPVYLPPGVPLTVGTFSILNDAYALLVNEDTDRITDTDVYLSSADGAPEALDPQTGTFAPLAVTTDAIGTKAHVSIAPGDGLLVHLKGPVPSGPQGVQAVVAEIRNSAGRLYAVDSNFPTALEDYGQAFWHQCPAGFTEVGSVVQVNGFGLCAPTSLAARRFYVGNVVADVGYLYSVQKGTATSLPNAGWNTCPGTSKLLGRHYTSNGFWVCME